MTEVLLLIAPVLLPLAGAALAILFRDRPVVSEGLTLAVLAVTTAAAFGLLAAIWAAELPPLTVFGGWPGGFGIAFVARLPGVVLVVATMLIALAVAVYDHAAIGPRRRRQGHDVLYLATVAAVNGAFLTGDLFNLYVWFELALLAALGLITLDRREAQVGAGVRYATFGISGASAILLGVGILYAIAGSLDLAVLARTLGSSPPTVAAAAAGAFLFGGFALKSGLVPLHAWLPSSYAPAQVSVAALFAGLLTKMGFYALLLVIAGLFGLGPAGLVALLGWIAASTMVLCAVAALAEDDMRRLLGYQVLAQVGYMAAGLAVATPEGISAAVFYMVHSMIVQANLFLGAGAIHRATGAWHLSTTGGMLRVNPVFAVLFAVPLLSLAGIPPLSGFWGKLLVFRSAIDAGDWLLLGAGVLAALVTIFSVAILWSVTCWKDLADRPVRRVPKTMVLGMAILSAATVAMGLFPDVLLAIATRSAEALLLLGAAS